METATVLVTGATGYIGSNVARALANAGYHVTGVARSEQAAAKLRAAGVAVHRGDLTDPAGLAAVARSSDAVIHSALVRNADTGRIEEAAVGAMLDALEGTAKPFLYTSGAWVIGNTGGRLAGEMFPLRPPPLVAWRPAIERMVLDAAGRKVCGVVIRPVTVYGRGGGAVATMIASAREQGVLRIIGAGDNHWSFVHIDDLADLYVRAMERSAPGEIYVAAEGPALRAREVAGAVCRVAGGARVESWTLEEARAVLGPLADCRALDQKIGSTKAARQLGWRPKGPSLLEELAPAAGAT